LQYLYHQAYNTEPEKFAKAPEVFWWRLRCSFCCC
jgi:hypothetical protein